MVWFFNKLVPFSNQTWQWEIPSTWRSSTHGASSIAGQTWYLYVSIAILRLNKQLQHLQERSPIIHVFFMCFHVFPCFFHVFFTLHQRVFLLQCEWRITEASVDWLRLVVQDFAESQIESARSGRCWEVDSLTDLTGIMVNVSLRKIHPRFFFMAASDSG